MPAEAAGEALPVVIAWTFHVDCNYRCPYCFFAGKWAEAARSNSLPALETLSAAWRRVHEQYGPCYILFSGAEPTVYPQLTELLAGIGRWHRWTFSTNLSWDSSRWEDFVARVDVSRGRVDASYHPSQMPDFAAFLSRALLVRSLGVRVNAVCIVAYPPVLPDLERYARELLEQGFSVRLQPLDGEYGGRRYPEAYSQAEKRLLSELNCQGSSALRREMDYAVGDQRPRGKPCRAGQRYCFVNQLGEVYRCTHVPHQPPFSLGSLYSGFRLTAEAQPCPMDSCLCGESCWLVEQGGHL